jgi:hypothetical protein
MTVYGETLVIGLDLKDRRGTKPRSISLTEWGEKYNNFWPDYIAKETHNPLFMFAHGMPPETIVFGCRAEYYFTHFDQKTFRQFKKLVAKEITQVLGVVVREEQIKPFYVQYTLDEEDYGGE